MVVQNEKPLGQVEEQIGKNNAAAEIDVLEEKAPAPVVPMPEEVAIVQNEREKKKAERERKKAAAIEGKKRLQKEKKHAKEVLRLQKLQEKDAAKEKKKNVSAKKREERDRISQGSKTRKVLRLADPPQSLTNAQVKFQLHVHLQEMLY